MHGFWPHAPEAVVSATPIADKQDPIDLKLFIQYLPAYKTLGFSKLAWTGSYYKWCLVEF